MARPDLAIQGTWQDFVALGAVKSDILAGGPVLQWKALKAV